MLSVPDFAPSWVCRVTMAFSPGLRFTRSSLSSTPGILPTSEMLIGPFALLVIATSADSPGFRFTTFLSALTLPSAKSGVVGKVGGMFLGLACSDECVMIPNGVGWGAFGSMKKYHRPSTSFQLLRVETLMGWPANPAIAMTVTHFTVALARVKLSEY